MAEKKPLVSSDQEGYGSSQKESISSLRKDVDTVINITRDNLGKVLDRDNKLGDLEDKTEQLSDNASIFKQKSIKLKWKMCGQNAKFWIIMASVLIVLLIFIIILATRKH